MANLVPIKFNNATVRAGHSASLNAAFADLLAASGIVPVVLNQEETREAGITPAVSGGSRGLQESYDAGSGPSSDHFEDNKDGHSAVDINNQRLFRNAIGDDQFENILAARGWRNITIDGDPFPDEPWHFANHDAESTAADTGSATLITNQEDDMRFIIISGALTGTAASYLLDAATGQRRYINATLVSVYNLGGVKVVNGVNQKDFDAIPKVPGSTDFDGTIVK